MVLGYLSTSTSYLQTTYGEVFNLLPSATLLQILLSGLQLADVFSFFQTDASRALVKLNSCWCMPDCRKVFAQMLVYRVPPFNKLVNHAVLADHTADCLRKRVSFLPILLKSRLRE